MSVIYLAGPPCFKGRDYLSLMAGKNVLIAYGEHNRAIYADTSVFGSCILDSGAWGAFRSGKRTPLAAYIDFLHSNGARFGWYAALDVIGDPTTSEDNYRTMLKEGLTPVPVFHGGENFSLLERYRESSPLVALGSAPAWGTKKRFEWLETVFSLYPHRYHIFRATGHKLLRVFSPESVDSSTWVRAASAGFIPTISGNRMYAPGLSHFERACAWANYFARLEKALLSKGKKLCQKKL